MTAVPTMTWLDWTSGLIRQSRQPNPPIASTALQPVATPENPAISSSDGRGKFRLIVNRGGSSIIVRYLAWMDRLVIIAVSVRAAADAAVARFTIARTAAEARVLPEFAHLIAIIFEEDLHGKLLGATSSCLAARRVR